MLKHPIKRISKIPPKKSQPQLLTNQNGDGTGLAREVYRFPVQARVIIRVYCRTQCLCESTVVRPHYHLHTGGNGPGNFHASSYRVATVLMKYVYSDGPSIILISIQKLEN